MLIIAQQKLNGCGITVLGETAETIDNRVNEIIIYGETEQRLCLFITMIDICQWRVSIGLWYSHQVSYSTIRNTNSTNGTVHSQSVVESGKSTFPAVVFVFLLLILSGDIELNPGPKTGNYHVIHCI